MRQVCSVRNTAFIPFDQLTECEKAAWLHRGVNVPPTYYYDQGFDPILGPPFPPVNYFAKVWTDGSQPRVTWTAPDLLLQTDPSFPEFTPGDPAYNPGSGADDTAITFQLAITNYSWPDWVAGTYIQNQRANHNGAYYYSLVDNNTDEPPSSKWAVDDTRFTIWISLRNQNTGAFDDFTQWWDSIGTNFGWTPNGFDAIGGNYAVQGGTNVPYFALAILRVLPRETFDLYIYAQAVRGSAASYSQTIHQVIEL